MFHCKHYFIYNQVLSSPPFNILKSLGKLMVPLSRHWTVVIITTSFIAFHVALTYKLFNNWTIHLSKSTTMLQDFFKVKHICDKICFLFYFRRNEILEAIDYQIDNLLVSNFPYKNRLLHFIPLVIDISFFQKQEQK